jgi:hypothetical protein
MKCRSVFFNCGVDQVAASLGGPDVIDEHVAHQQLAVGPADQVVTKLQGDDLRQVLVLGNRPDLLFAELAQAKTVLERQHRSLSVAGENPYARSSPRNPIEPH